MQTKHIDYPLFFLVFGLVVFGMIMISSVSVYPSYKVTSEMVNAWALDEATNSFYLVRNLMHVFVSFFVFAFIVKVPYELYEKYARHIFLLGIGLLVVVLFIGSEYNGARWWLNIPGVPFSLQPVEFAKLALIIYLASFLKRARGTMSIFESGALPFFSILAAVVILLALQPDFGSMLIIGPLALVMYFIGGGSVRYIAIVIALFTLLSASVYVLGRYDTPDERNTFSYITDRVDNFLSDNQTLIEKRTIHFQTEQGLIAIGSGGFFGLGFGESVQKFGYLPEAQGDFIFSVVAEELGFLGVGALVVVYLVLAERWFRIAKESEDLFARYVALGITSWIVIQAFVNIGVNLNIVPLTGVTLPFVSYGGSSLLSLLIAVGILLNISRSTKSKTTTGSTHSFSRKYRMG